MHARLAALAERCYPPVARRFRQQGVVELLFSVDGAGALTQQTVGRSSGVASLDRAAMECVVPQAAPFPAPTRGYRFRVPVRFGQSTR
jgi:protein TonB